MPAAVAVPLIIGAAGVGGTLAAAKMSSNAAKRGAQLQSDATNKAAEFQAKSAADSLAFQKDMWNTSQQNAAPYLQMGRNALGGLNQITGMDGGGGQRFGSSGPQQQQQPNMWNPAQSGSYVGPQMVQMKAPDGSVRPVPRAMVPHYQSRGGQVVG